MQLRRLNPEDFLPMQDNMNIAFRFDRTETPVDDGNEYFRRPNKSGTGWSASLKDRVFYVFTSNAYPFEPNKAYSPSIPAALISSKAVGETAVPKLSQSTLTEATLPTDS